jgi:hypothetical protein
MFHRKFPSKRITLYQLRKVYQKDGIKKKKIKKAKIIAPDHAKKIRLEALEAKANLMALME